jgi:hypothetical protein
MSMAQPPTYGLREHLHALRPAAPEERAPLVEGPAAAQGDESMDAC